MGKCQKWHFVEKIVFVIPDHQNKLKTSQKILNSMEILRITEGTIALFKSKLSSFDSFRIYSHPTKILEMQFLHVSFFITNWTEGTHPRPFPAQILLRLWYESHSNLRWMVWTPCLNQLWQTKRSTKYQPVQRKHSQWNQTSNKTGTLGENRSWKSMGRWRNKRKWLRYWSWGKFPTTLRQWNKTSIPL